ncbi:MAG: GNAT family N-acetyltransferase [Peptostreptococcaceae bacterium]|nr:GNAT family N-acetyltransferase [Peptostreptococcaceae bacterium]
METKNLVLKDTELSDCKYFYKWEKDSEITKYLSIDNDVQYEDVVKTFVLASNDSTKLMFTIISKAEKAPIGRVSISRISSRENSLDITKLYIGNKNFQGKGYGIELMEALTRYAFFDLNMERVTLDYYIDNKRAELLYNKIGFKSEGIMRNATIKNGKYYDLKLMSMLRNEYFNMYKKV